MSNVTALRPNADDTDTAVGVEGFEDLPPVMAPRALAEVLGVTTRTLERWRVDSTGPNAFKIPGSSLIRYARVDVITWINAARGSES